MHSNRLKSINLPAMLFIGKPNILLLFFSLKTINIVPSIATYSIKVYPIGQMLLIPEGNRAFESIFF